MHPVIFIVGPTACGKSALALHLAEKFKGCIMNCDSLQFYRRLDIGTAKPPIDERERVPHFLFDFVEPGQILTAGDFRKAALEVLARELKVRPVFAVGGSGFYIQALEKGMFNVPKPDPKADAVVRQRLHKQGLAELFKQLEILDPEYADEINPNDSYRIVRALVVHEDSGRKMSDLRKSFRPEPFPYPLLKLGLDLDRAGLEPRVTVRVAKMLEDGFVNEVKSLLNEGFSEWPPLHSVGYQECVDHLAGKVSLETLAPLIVEKTLQLSKKQRTWFKRDKEIHWFHPDDARAKCETLVTEFLDRKSPGA